MLWHRFKKRVRPHENTIAHKAGAATLLQIYSQTREEDIEHSSHYEKSDLNTGVCVLLLIVEEQKTLLVRAQSLGKRWTYNAIIFEANCIC